MITKFTVTVTNPAEDGAVFVTETFEVLEDAIRYWDRQTFELAERNTKYEGGIEVKQLDERGFTVRDGWVLHLWDGQTYLNPHLMLAGLTYTRAEIVNGTGFEKGARFAQLTAN